VFGCYMFLIFQFLACGGFVELRSYFSFSACLGKWEGTCPFKWSYELQQESTTTSHTCVELFIGWTVMLFHIATFRDMAIPGVRFPLYAKDRGEIYSSDYARGSHFPWLWKPA
jgi:hypothetical protein